MIDRFRGFECAGVPFAVFAARQTSQPILCHLEAPSNSLLPFIPACCFDRANEEWEAYCLVQRASGAASEWHHAVGSTMTQAVDNLQAIILS